MRDYFTKALMEEAKIDQDLVFITGDLGFGVFERFEELYPNQYFNLGIAEQAMTGVATGMALEGKRTITYSIGNFPTLRCLEQIRNDAAYHNVNLTIVAIGGGFAYGQLGMSHHATEDMAIMKALPNVDVLVPGTDSEAEEISKIALNRNCTSYIRLDKSAAIETDEVEPFRFGMLRRFRSGSDVAIIGVGGILEEALKAAEELKDKHSINASVYGCHSLKPFDSNGFAKILSEIKNIVTVEEHNMYGGLGSTICENIVKDKLPYDSFTQISLNDEYSAVVGDQNFLRDYYKLTSKHIINNILDIFKT